MAITVGEFVERLTSSGLLTAPELDELMEEVPQVRASGDIHDLARELVSRNRLTLYQVATLSQGKSDKLAVGPYVILDKIATGGMGEIYKAVRKGTHRLVALKVLAPKALSSNEMVQRFHREISVVTKLTHPNIVAALDSGTDGSTNYLAMEFVEGPTLVRLLKQHGSLPVETAANYAMQAARGLAYAHENNIIHRDIKPANLMVDARGEVKILDLGLARIEDENCEPLTRSGNVMGTVDFMAPEQAFDTKRADHRADIYSLGCTIYFLFTGSVVFDEPTLIKKAVAHRDKPVPSLRKSRPDVPEAVDLIVQRMLAKDPQERVQSALEVLKAFEAAGYSIAEPAPLPPDTDVSHELPVWRGSDSAKPLPGSSRRIRPPEPPTPIPDAVSTSPPPAPAPGSSSSVRLGGKLSGDDSSIIRPMDSGFSGFAPPPESDGDWRAILGFVTLVVLVAAAVAAFILM